MPASASWIRHQPGPAAVGRLAATVRTRRARGAALRQDIPHTGERVSTTVDGKPGVAILLTYGPDRDWLKNLVAAGGGRMRRNGKSFGIADPEWSPRPRRRRR